jgi:hypothetical protein
MGAIGRTARSLTAKCQTNLVLSVRSARFVSAGVSRAGEQRSERKLADLTATTVVLAGRSLAASGVFGCARMILTVSTVCGRRNAAIASAQPAKRVATAEWSGCKAGESVIGRGPNRTDTWREATPLGDVSAPAPRRVSSKCRCCEAQAAAVFKSRSEATRQRKCFRDSGYLFDA